MEPSSPVPRESPLWSLHGTFCKVGPQDGRYSHRLKVHKAVLLLQKLWQDVRVTLALVANSHTFSRQQGGERDTLWKSLSPYESKHQPSGNHHRATLEALATACAHHHHLHGAGKSSCRHNISPKNHYFCISGT